MTMFMNPPEENLRLMLDTGVVAVIRTSSAARLVQVAEALSTGGICCIEITMTTPNALTVIEDVATELKGVLVGAGTVLDAETARAAIVAGAQYIVSPTFNREVVNTAKRYGKIIIPGAMTPTEILTAWQAGADMVKIFPAQTLGPAYLQSLRGPLPDVLLVPTGGISADNAGDFIQAGAAVVCAGSWLVDSQTILEERYELLAQRSRMLLEAVRNARKGTGEC